MNRRSAVWCVAVFVLAGVVGGLSSGAQAQQSLNIACEGNQSTGGGQRLYQYTLKNVSANPVTFTSWVLATDDVDGNNYSNWLLPVNWVSSIYVPADSNMLVLLTTGVKVAHGTVDNNNTRLAAGEITFACTATQPFTLNSNATVTFGFDNTHMVSEDVEWVVGAAGVKSVWASPVAGPLGTYTDGPVHSPVPEPATLCLLALGLPLLARRRREHQGGCRSL